MLEIWKKCLEFRIHIGVFLKVTRSLFLTQNKVMWYTPIRVIGVTNGDKMLLQEEYIIRKMSEQ
jgi:hypothetical protein